MSDAKDLSSDVARPKGSLVVARAGARDIEHRIRRRDHIGIQRVGAALPTVVSVSPLATPSSPVTHTTFVVLATLAGARLLSTLSWRHVDRALLARRRVDYLGFLHVVRQPPVADLRHLRHGVAGAAAAHLQVGRLPRSDAVVLARAVRVQLVVVAVAAEAVARGRARKMHGTGASAPRLLGLLHFVSPPSDDALHAQQHARLLLFPAFL